MTNGAIDFDIAGEIVQKHICSFNSTKKDHGQHSLNAVKSGKYKNFAIESSINSCGLFHWGDSPIYFVYGIIMNTYNNISSCLTYDRSGFRIADPYNRSITKFCTLYGNEAGNDCIDYESYSTNIECSLSLTNIINNSAYHAFISSTTDGLIESCAILNNKGKFIFYCIPLYYNCSITISKCFCDRKSNTGNVNISYINTDPFINNVDYFSSYICEATKFNLNDYLEDNIKNTHIINIFHFFRYDYLDIVSLYIQLNYSS